MKFFYGKYTNIICEDYDDEFTVEFNADMYGSPSEGCFLAAGESGMMSDHLMQ